jgi:hypothetical protein
MDFFERVSSLTYWEKIKIGNKPRRMHVSVFCVGTHGSAFWRCSHANADIGFKNFKANKGTRWMPRVWEAKKDVVSCDKLRGAAHERYIRRFPNGTTCYTEGITLAAMREPTPRTETSKYREEKKIIMIPQVVASEQGRAQTGGACSAGVVGLLLEMVINLNQLESWAIAGESPVGAN